MSKSKSKQQWNSAKPRFFENAFFVVATAAIGALALAGIITATSSSDAVASESIPMSAPAADSCDGLTIIAKRHCTIHAQIEAATR